MGYIKRLFFVLLAILFINNLYGSDIDTKKEQIIELYIATFNRAPDRAGLDYWLNEMESNHWSIEMVAQSMFMQPETINLYKDKDIFDFIKAVYKNVLDREPDDGGFAYWYQELSSNNIPKEQFILAIINGAKAQGEDSDDAKLLFNKIKIAKYFTLEKGLNDANLAKEIISQVDSTDESVERVKKLIDNESSNESIEENSEVNENIDINSSSDSNFDNLSQLDSNLSVDEVANEFNSIKSANYKESLPDETLTIRQDDTKENLRAYLWLPKDYDSNKKYPAVVLAHGCGGVHYTDEADKWNAQYIAGKFRVWGKLLSNNGFIVLLVDSFTTRDNNGDVGGGVCDTKNPLDRPSKIDPISVRPSDIASGVAYLKSRDDVDSNRVGVLAFSNGGTAGLVLSNHQDLANRADELEQEGKEVFDLPYEQEYKPSIIITLYPGCGLNGYSQETSNIFENRFKVDTPTYIFMASDDSMLPNNISECNHLYDLDNSLHLTTTPNTDHQFDYYESSESAVKNTITEIVNLLREM